MFRWMMDWFRDQKIAADFKETEQRARLARAREADDKFSTLKLENEIKERMAVPHRDADARYNETITRLKRAISWQVEEESRNQVRSAALKRDYKGELNELYAELNELKVTIAQLYEDKNQAHEDLKEARESIDAWYGKSRGKFFGNAGKELPRHALFGQSFGDLESYKSDREEAYETITECAEEINDLKQKKHAIFEQIQRVKQARGAMFELRNKQGYSIGRVDRELCMLSRGLKENRDRLRQNEMARAAFLDREKTKNGVEDLERRIRSLRQQHQAFIQAFVEPDAVEERRSTHREQWLKCNH